MEGVTEAVVIVGAGLAGLATALGLHRMGIRSLVLESSESLRASGFAFTTWTNAWRALDALGVGDSLRRQHVLLERGLNTSASSGAQISQLSLTRQGRNGQHEVRCVMRNVLLHTLEKELPDGTIRYSSKLVSIDEDPAHNLKLLHLADGSILKTKVLVGCDGVNSLVSKWLGLRKPSFSGRSACRGFSSYPDGHGFDPNFSQYFGQGFRFGTLPCNEKSMYWFFTWTPTTQDKEVEENPTKMKEFVLSKLQASTMPIEVIQVVENSETSNLLASPLRFRWPFDLICRNINKGNVCVAGDAFHPMTPDLGQGGCSALEDGVVLARCLGEALLANGRGAEGEYGRIKEGLEKYGKERRWRGFGLIATAYVFGFIQQSDGVVMNFLRDKLSGIMVNQLLKISEYDCGKILG